MKIDFKNAQWINEVEEYSFSENTVSITTETHRDFWQGTGSCKSYDNAPALLVEVDEKSFSFTFKTVFDYKSMYDQCGACIYIDKENWLKVSIEYQEEKAQKLGSVVTQNAYSDWASFDIERDIKEIYYRVSRNKGDYTVEYSFDGKNFTLMRLFHLIKGEETICIGLYAASPMESSFIANFSEMEFSANRFEE